MSERFFPNVKIRKNVVCQSSRHGAIPQLIVVHSTEGQNLPNSTKDLSGLASFFDNIKTQASSHVAADSDGFSARMVPDNRKAWTCAFYNSVSLNIELIGFASQGRWTDKEIDECARWIAYWSIKYDIPIRKGKVSVDGRVIRKGVVRHSELGNLGGNHHDPGTFPLAKCHARARHFRNLQLKHRG